MYGQPPCGDRADAPMPSASQERHGFSRGVRRAGTVRIPTVSSHWITLDSMPRAQSPIQLAIVTSSGVHPDSLRGPDLGFTCVPYPDSPTPLLATRMTLVRREHSGFIAYGGTVQIRNVRAERPRGHDTLCHAGDVGPRGSEVTDMSQKLQCKCPRWRSRCARQGMPT